MRILVCVKRVPSPGAIINVTEDEQSVDTTNLGFTTSPHEECALEEAVQITEREEGTVTVLTLGPPESEEQLRYAASVGATEIILVPTDGTDWDPQRTAAAISEAIEASESENGVYDLVLFGNESADSSGFQVGIRVANKLGRPMVNGIKGIDFEGEELLARREVDGGFEVYRISRPAMLGIKEGINLPRYPTMRGRLASKKVELGQSEANTPAGDQGSVRLHQPTETVSETTILGTDESAASAVVDILEEIGVLS